MAGIVRPACPGVAYDMSNLKVKEVREFVRKARTKSDPGMLHLSYKPYKNCPLVLGELVVFLHVPGKTGILRMASKYSKRRTQSALAALVRYFSTERREKDLLGVIPCGITNFLMDNGFIDNSV